MSTDPKTSSISIIIPTRNEAESLGRILPQLVSEAGVEVIVADGGSTDNTVRVANSLGVQVLVADAEKAARMNAGAEAAHGDILLFLHGDTRLDHGFAEHIHDAVRRPGFTAGAFQLTIDGKGIGLRVIEWLANFRSRIMQMPYGDQGIFITAEKFSEVGGYPTLPIMEDFELMRRLKRRGHITILPFAATTSPRRWQKLGIFRTTFINQAIIIGYLLGVNPQKLADWYRKG